MATEKAYIVQFPHPGGERTVPRIVRANGWSPSDGKCRHTRTFLRSQGHTVVDGQVSKEAQPLMFWGEWEAPAHIVQPFSNTQGNRPKRLWSPQFSRHADAGTTVHNTDPFDWGPHFYYSYCGQHRRSKPKILTEGLPEGSLVLFGSTLGGQFVLDTVLVVGSSQPYKPHDRTTWEKEIPKAMREVTLKPIEKITSTQNHVHKLPEITLAPLRPFWVDYALNPHLPWVSSLKKPYLCGAKKIEARENEGPYRRQGKHSHPGV